MTVDEIVARLGLQPHPEGGCYKETWRHQPKSGGRGAGTAIYFLLRAGEVSRWHRVDADEIWHHYQGAPLELLMTADLDEAGSASRHVLGPLGEGEAQPQVRVPAGIWQSARSLGDFTLVGCTVSPAFLFEGFELDERGPDSRT